jgi:hypothetical protein
MPDRDDEIRPEEHHHLARRDDLPGGRRLAVADVADGLEHHEQRVVVALQLGPLVGVHRVLDGELVQAEDVRDAGDLLGVGLVQPIQTKPSPRRRTSASARSCVQRPGSRTPST